jgi:predicted peptidase
MLENFPDRIAAAVPICGGGNSVMAHRFVNVQTR